MKKEKVKYQTKRVTIPAATYAAEFPANESLDLDSAYDQVVGVAIHRVVDSGVANGDYKIGLSDDNGVIHDPTHISGWATAKDDGTNPNERFKEITVDVRGAGQIQCIVKLPAQVLATALVVEFVFKLEQNRERTA